MKQATLSVYSLKEHKHKDFSYLANIKPLLSKNVDPHWLYFLTSNLFNFDRQQFILKKTNQGISWFYTQKNMENLLKDNGLNGPQFEQFLISLNYEMYHLIRLIRKKKKGRARKYLINHNLFYSPWLSLSALNEEVIYNIKDQISTNQLLLKKANFSIYNIFYIEITD